MSLRYIVPTLGLLAATPVAASAADIGGLSIGGYVDSVLEFTSADEEAAIARGGSADDDTFIEFHPSAQLEVGYAIGNAVNAYVELFYDESTGTAVGSTSLELEEAYVTWAVSEQAALTFGRFHNWIGWEGHDAPELYRVNFSNIANSGLYGDNTGGVEGVGLNANVNEQFRVGLYVVDAIWGEENTPTAGLFPRAVAVGKAPDDLAVGADATFTMEGIGWFDLDLAYGIAEGGNEAGATENEDAFGVDFNFEIDALREDNGLLFFGDVIFVDFDVASAMGVLAGANWRFQTATPMSATLMVDYLEPNDDADDDEQLEVAAALLTNPTSDENFSLNFEARFIQRGEASIGTTADEDNEVGFFVEALAVIP